MKTTRLARRRSAAENVKSYALIAPYMLIFFTFSVLPVLIAIFFSFTRFSFPPDKLSSSSNEPSNVTSSLIIAF